MKNIDEPARSRGRPRSFDRGEALARAAETFWRMGYEGASITELTGAMGITPQSFYAAFTSKSALYREAINWYADTTGAFVSRALSTESSAPAAFRRVLEEAAQEFTRPGRPSGCMIATAILNCGDEHHELAKFVAEQRASTLALLRDCAERGIAAGDYPANTSADSLARYIAAIIQGLSVQAIDGASADDLRSIIEIMPDFVALD